jgi:hypothetical protein
VWTGVVVVVLVQVWPEAKRRQLKRWLDAYEAARPGRALAGATRRRETTKRRGRGSGCTAGGVLRHALVDESPLRSVAAGQPRGDHIRATNSRIAADNSGPIPGSSPATFG